MNIFISHIILTEFSRSTQFYSRRNPIYLGNVSGGNHNLRENSCKPQQKNHLNSRKKITDVDDMMIHNLVKYFVQT